MLEFYIHDSKQPVFIHVFGSTKSYIFASYCWFFVNSTSYLYISRKKIRKKSTNLRTIVNADLLIVNADLFIHNLACCFGVFVVGFN